MKTFRPIQLAALALALVTAFGIVVSSASESAVEETRLALDGLDPVLLVAGEERRGDESTYAVHGPYLYRFTSAETRERFTADPERFAIRGGDRCAMTPSVAADPAVFAVHDEKIYAFATPHCRQTFLAEPARYIERRSVALLLWDGVELLDFAGPGEVFAAAQFDVYTVAATREPIVSQGFVTVAPQYSIAEAPRPDILVVPGGGTRSAMNDEALVAWVAETGAAAEHVMSVCTGAFVLAKAGLLDGLEATTHHASIDDLVGYASKTTVHSGRRYVDNGRVATAAGVSAGIDLALHLVGRIHGAERAQQTARYMEYRWTLDEAAPVRQAAADSP